MFEAIVWQQTRSPTRRDLDTSDIKPTTHPIDGLENVFREDIPRDCLTNEEATSNAQHKKDGYFKAPRILKE